MAGFRRRRTTPEQSNTPNPAASTTWFASAGLIGLVIVALIGVLIYILVKPDTPAPSAAVPAPTAGPAPGATATAAPPPSGADTGRPTGCHTTGTDQTVPTGTPAGVSWTLVAGVAVPTSSADGPALHADAGVAYCYSHTPVGALLAASNFGQGTGPRAAIGTALLTHSVVPGAYSQQAGAQVSSKESSDSAKPQLAGFRLISYSVDQASVSLAYSLSGQSGSYGVLTLALQWNQGDWRVVMQPGPSAFVTSSSVTSLAGFAPWSGVS